MAIVHVNFYQVSLPNVFGENIELKHRYFFHVDQGEIARKGRFTDVKENQKNYCIKAE